MFTGIIETLGRLERKARIAGGEEMLIAAPSFAGTLALGESVSVSGVCLTVTAMEGERFGVQAIRETLSRTTLGDLDDGGSVNLERSLRATDRLGGHFVTGHVDATARVLEVAPHGAEVLLRIEVPAGYEGQVVEKGSIALDGVSLTVGRVGGSDATVFLIPFTRERTTLGGVRPGDRVNMETDILGKYVLRSLALEGRAARAGAPGALRGETR
jgi:riboflavin synthase